MRFVGIKLCVILLLATIPALAAPSMPDIVYPRPESASDNRTRYPEMLLRLALSKSCPACKARPSATLMMQHRSLAELENGNGGITLAWSMTSNDRENHLLPVRIPIDRGLIGWRIPLVMPTIEEKLAGVRTAADLHAFTFGQGEDWPDYAILRSNRYLVYGTAQYETLFDMLAAGRFDLFPRSPIEIGAEARDHAASGMIIDSHIAIHYPAAFYFFVNKNNTALAAIVRRGLEISLTDGSFERLFQRTFGEEIRALHFENRVIIELNNPLVPPGLEHALSAPWQQSLH